MNKNADIVQRVNRIAEVSYDQFDPEHPLVKDDIYHLHQLKTDVRDFNGRDHPAMQAIELLNNASIGDSFEHIQSHNETLKNTTSYYGNSHHLDDDDYMKRIIIQSIGDIQSTASKMIADGVITPQNFADFKCQLSIYKEDRKVSQVDVDTLQDLDVPIEDKMINISTATFDPSYGISRQLLLKSVTDKDNFEFTDEFLEMMNKRLSKLYKDGKMTYANVFNTLITKSYIHNLDAIVPTADLLENIDFRVFGDDKTNAVVQSATTGINKYFLNCAVRAFAPYILTQPTINKMNDGTFNAKTSRSLKFKSLAKIDAELFDADGKPLGANVDTIRRILPLVKSAKYVSIDVVTKDHFISSHDEYNFINMMNKAITSSKSDHSKIIRLLCFNGHITDASYAKPTRIDETKYIMSTRANIDTLYAKHKYDANEFGVIETKLLKFHNNETALRIVKKEVKPDGTTSYCEYYYKTYQHLVHREALTAAQEGKMLIQVPLHDAGVDEDNELDKTPADPNKTIVRMRYPIDVLKNTKIRPMVFCTKSMKPDEVIKIDGNFAYPTRLLNNPSFTKLPTTYQITELNSTIYEHVPGSVGWLFISIDRPHSNPMVNRLFGYDPNDVYWHNGTKYFAESIKMISTCHYEASKKLLKFHKQEMPRIVFKYLMISVNFVNPKPLTEVFGKFIDMVAVNKNDIGKVKRILQCFNHSLGTMCPRTDKRRYMTFDNERDAVLHYITHRRNTAYHQVQISANVPFVSDDVVKVSPETITCWDMEAKTIVDPATLVQPEQPEQPNTATYTVSYSLADTSKSTNAIPELSYYAYEAARLSVIDVALNFRPEQIVATTTDSLAFDKSLTTVDDITKALEHTYYNQTIQAKKDQTIEEYGFSWKFEDFIQKPVGGWSNDGLDVINHELLKEMCQDEILYQHVGKHGPGGAGKTYDTKEKHAKALNSTLHAQRRDLSVELKRSHKNKQPRLIVDNASSSTSATEKMLIPTTYTTSTIHSALNLNGKSEYESVKYSKMDKQFGKYSCMHAGIRLIDESDATDIDIVQRFIKRSPYSIVVFTEDPNQIAPRGCGGAQFSQSGHKFQVRYFNKLYRFRDQRTIDFNHFMYALTTKYRKMIIDSSDSNSDTSVTSGTSVTNANSTPDYNTTAAYYKELIEYVKSISIDGDLYYNNYKEALQSIVDNFVLNIPFIIITKQTVINEKKQNPRGEIYNKMARQYVKDCGLFSSDNTDDFKINVVVDQYISTDTSVSVTASCIRVGVVGTLERTDGKYTFLRFNADSEDEKFSIDVSRTSAANGTSATTGTADISTYFTPKIAFSCNKVQGLTIKYSKIILEGVFSSKPNDIYVACSRQVTLDNIKFIPTFNDTKLIRQEIDLIRVIETNKKIQNIPQATIDLNYQHIHGCTQAEFKKIMNDKMISRYGKIHPRSVLELDHIIPCSFADHSFANHHSNLQWLLRTENRAKSNIIDVNHFL